MLATIATTDTTALQRLMTWLSPAFPVGAFAYSAGLETAIADGRIGTAQTLADWITGSLRHGNAVTDAILLADAHRNAGDPAALSGLADFCLALTPSRQRCQEVATLGNAFLEAAEAWAPEMRRDFPRPCPYPVAVGAVAAMHNVPLAETATAYLTALAQGQISVAVRAVPLGQTDGLRLLAALEPLIAECGRHAATSTLDDLGAIGYASDIAAMAHETLHSRIFRS